MKRTALTTAGLAAAVGLALSLGLTRHTATASPAHLPIAASQSPSEAHATLAPATGSPTPVQTHLRVLRATPASRSRPLPHKENDVYPTEAQWAALRQCENGGLYTSKPGDYYRGAYQFDLQTWRSVGGKGDPADASPAEQDYRARLLYAERSWTPWPVCGRKYLR